MKNCDEMVNSLFERRAQYEVEQKRKRKVLARTATSMCCVGFVTLLGLGVLQSGGGKTPLEQTIGGDVQHGVGDTLEESKGGSTTTPAISESANSPATNDQICIQKIEELPTNTTKMLIALMSDDFIPMSRDEINAYYGVNIFPTVPSDLEGKTEQTFGIFKRKATGEVYWDSNAISYANADGSRNVNVNVDKDCVPVDFWIVFDEIQSMSRINNIEVGIGQTTDGAFYAEFLYHNAGFRIVAEGLTQDEFVAIISSLIV